MTDVNVSHGNPSYPHYSVRAALHSIQPLPVTQRVLRVLNSCNLTSARIRAELSGITPTSKHETPLHQLLIHSTRLSILSRTVICRQGMRGYRVYLETSEMSLSMFHSTIYADKKSTSGLHPADASTQNGAQIRFYLAMDTNITPRLSRKESSVAAKTQRVRLSLMTRSQTEFVLLRSSKESLRYFSFVLSMWCNAHCLVLY